MKRLILIAFCVLVSLTSAQSRGKDLKVLYWNVQNGMWSGQDDNYDAFVSWVKAQKPDVCIWAEAETIYYTGTSKRLPREERYFIWDKVAPRYGHKHIYVAGHRDGYPQVITSKYPIESVEKIVGDENFVVCHGAGWARIKVAGKILNLVSLHTWPQQNHFNCKGAAPEIIKASAERGEGDMYRAQELKWICEHTILTDSNASENLWLMAGDFNAVSPKDNWVYKLPENSTKLLPHKYILENTPYIDVIWERSPRNFYTTTFEWMRIDFVYCSPALYDCVSDARIVEDGYTKPVRDQRVKSFLNPSDHLPIIVTLKIK
jgi:exonuclease III